MNWTAVLQNIDARTAQQFVVAARHVIDALLIEAQRVEQTHTPAPVDYAVADLPRSAPPGGWISPSELHNTARSMAEAIAAERWTDGLLTALRLGRTLGL